VILFLDTEFSGLNQPDPALISVALVKENSAFCYAELPPDTYLAKADPWVIENVIPLLWGGGWELPRAAVGAHLVTWIKAIDDRVMIVTDSPDFDFEIIKPLLNPWPKNLAKQAMRFDSFAMGQSRQPWLASVIASYHAQSGNVHPEHHAVHDAQALRTGFMAALEAGWWPRSI
jgi:hypothetical protein